MISPKSKLTQNTKTPQMERSPSDFNNRKLMFDIQKDKKSNNKYASLIHKKLFSDSQVNSSTLKKKSDQ